MKDEFRKFSNVASAVMGSPAVFFIAAAIVAIWALTGPLFNFSDTWQLVINTGTTVITFLMVFIIQNSQNRDAKAIQLKLDELLRAIDGARNRLVNLESMRDDEIVEIENEFKKIAEADACSTRSLDSSH